MNTAEQDPKVISPTADAINRAAAVLRAGGLVAFPTETVYGLGADASNPTAVGAMFAAKGRPADHPAIVHLGEARLIDQLAIEVPAAARELAAAFWPGPMTLVLRRSKSVCDLVTGGLDTVGLRVPAHPVAQQLLRRFGGPIAAPSANRFGRVSPTRAEHVVEELGCSVDVILDGGPCEVGLESTIIDLSSAHPAVLRPGAVTAEQIRAVLGRDIGRPAAAAPRVSGSLPTHYAPRARVEIVPDESLSVRAQSLAVEGKKVAILSLERMPEYGNQVIQVITPESPADLAHELYSLLRRVDELGCDVALISLPAEEGLGAAIADRLRKAAGPR
jgi:L-threonylcarbamoyladenylate synthase